VHFSEHRLYSTRFIIISFFVKIYQQFHNTNRPTDYLKMQILLPPIDKIDSQDYCLDGCPNDNRSVGIDVGI
jgi:hypothetical protein